MGKYICKILAQNEDTSRDNVQQSIELSKRQKGFSMVGLYQEKQQGRVCGGLGDNYEGF